MHVNVHGADGEHSSVNATSFILNDRPFFSIG
jgi:hypothetical protein